MEVIRTTGLTSAYTCPYKSHHDVYNPDPKNTYHGDMFNIGITSTNADFKPLLDYYARQINPDFKAGLALGELMGKAKMFIQLMKDRALEQGNQVYQEAKMYHRVDQNMWIEGVPDVFEILKTEDEDGLRARCYDLKCSTHSRYTGDDMWEFNLQTYIYPMMIMNVFGFDKCSFTYIVGDKTNGKLKKEKRIRTLGECVKKVDEAVEDYKKNKMFDDYPARENKLCMFCSYGAKGDKSCPLLKAKQPKIIKSEELTDIEKDLFS